MSPKPSESILDPDRISQARTRRGLTKAALAPLLGITPRTLSTYETHGAPTALAPKLVEALGFPEEFFATPTGSRIDGALVNFRAARAAGARPRAAAVAAGELGTEVDRWISKRFTLPALDLPRCPDEDPELAAETVRGRWALGTNPLPNAVQLAESRGVRVFTLPPIAEEVDAFSCWNEGVPYIFLSRRRSPERMRFDVAHELGHLVLHHAGKGDDKIQEKEADRFASAFLMPRDMVPRYLRRNPTVEEILEVRSRIKVSAMALAKRLHTIGRASDWHYRQLCIDLSSRGYRSGEPGGMPTHEMSRVFPQVLGSGKVSARDIAADIHVPVSEIRALTFGVELREADTATDAPSVVGASRPARSKGHLRVVGS